MRKPPCGTPARKARAEAQVAASRFFSASTSNVAAGHCGSIFSVSASRSSTVRSSDAAVERCREPFALMGSLVAHFGPVGAGTNAKIARNLITFDPSLNFDWENDKQFFGLAVTAGRVRASETMCSRLAPMAPGKIGGAPLLPPAW